MVLLVLIYACNVVDRNIISILAEPIKKSLALSDTQLGLLTGLAFALFYTFFGIPAGWLADRLGRLRVLTLCAVVWSVFSMMGGFAANFGQLAIARMGVGFGEAGGAAPSYSLIAGYYPADKRGNALGLFNLGSPAGTMVGTFACAWIAAHYGWRAALVAVSLPGVVFATLLWATVREPTNAHDGAPPPPVALWAAVKTYFADGLLRNLAITAGFSSFTSYAMAAWLPAFLMRVRGMSLHELGAYYGVAYAVTFGLGLWGGGWLADRLISRGRRVYALVPMGGLLLAAPFFIAGLMVGSWQAALPLLCVSVAAIGMFLAPAVTCVQNVSPAASRSVYGALFLFVNNLVGAGLGPVYSGKISDLAKAHHFAPFGMAPLGVGLMACLPVLLIAAIMQWRNAGRLHGMETQ